jgi:hypothetical protein
VVIAEPPDASLITLGEADDDGTATVTGLAGSVQPDALVAVACLDTAHVKVVQADERGAFQASLFAPAGAHIMVKHIRPYVLLEEVSVSAGGTGWGDISLGWFNATSGAMLPQSPDPFDPDDSRSFRLVGEVAHERGLAYWTFSGEIGPVEGSGNGLEIPISGTVRIISPAIQSGFDTSSVTVSASFDLPRLFDADGVQVPIAQALASNLMTPTGLPISRDNRATPITTEVQLTGWTQVSDHVLEAELDTSVVVPADTDPGHYAPRVAFGFNDRIPVGSPPDLTENLFAVRPGFLFAGMGEQAFLPIVWVGDPAPPRLTWTLLTDTLHAGTRGVVAREDRRRFGMIPLTTFPDSIFVIPRDDARTGEPLSYRLEPFMPLISMSDRGTGNVPPVPFALPSGALEAVVEAPDGTTTNLGPSPFVQPVTSTPAFVHGRLRDNDGGAMHEVFQLTTLDDAFRHEFTDYGHHVVTMSGAVEDIWGNVYEGGGTYDVFVARPLAITSGMLPTTPFEVGDVFSPALRVDPAAPADIELRFTLMVDSDPDLTEERVVTGRANRFGSFHPGEDFDPIVIEGPGEYLVDITASYVDEDGVEWMGSATWGGVVETPGTPLVAHGRRGMDDPDYQDLLWFFHAETGFSGVAHTTYPYLLGDVYWGIEGSGVPPVGADSILPAITIQDTTGEIESIIESRWEDSEHVGIFPFETFEDRLAAAELPLFSTCSDGNDPLWSPDLIDQWAYAYRSSQRPGARVHETVSEEGLGIAYWRYNATYGDQVGMAGDLPNDLKWNYGGAVFRYAPEEINEYAIYGSLWVLLADDDEIGPRVTPPFQGAAGGPDGGPILTLGGEEIDIFLLARSGGPGQILEVGDTFSLSGNVGPPLDSKVTATVTSPSKVERTITGYANKVGYFHDPDGDFMVEEVGVWTVELEVLHDGMTSAGAVQPPYPTGSVLGAAEGTYSFYVVPRGARPIDLVAPSAGLLHIPGQPIPPVEIVGRVPIRARDAMVWYTITMPGFLLEQGTVIPTGNRFTVTYDPETLNEEFPNIDLTAYDAPRAGLGDRIRVNMLLCDDRDRCAARSLAIDAEEVVDPTVQTPPRRRSARPVRRLPGGSG